MEKFEGLSSVELISDEELYEIEGGGAWASTGNIVKKYGYGCSSWRFCWGASRSDNWIYKRLCRRS